MKGSLLVLRIAYNGREFHGYQRQPGLKTVENSLFSFLTKSGCVTRLPPWWYSYSGRTDKGVHALSQTVSLIANSECNVEKLAETVWEGSQGSIIVWAYNLGVGLEFKARYWALWREYLYVDEPVNYACDDFRESLEQARVITSLRDHRVFYRGVKRFEKSYFHRRIINVSMKMVNGLVIWGFQGESFPQNYIRRVIHVFRTRPCGEDLLEHAKKTPISLSEPERLFLTGVKYPIALKRIYSKEELREKLLLSVFRRESYYLLSIFSFFDDERRFSRPF